MKTKPQTLQKFCKHLQSRYEFHEGGKIKNEFIITIQRYDGSDHDRYAYMNTVLKYEIGVFNTGGELLGKHLANEENRVQFEDLPELIKVFGSSISKGK